MLKRDKKAEEGASWMDTYGDMVTLLLCFFVLLYAISSVDQGKYENLVKSLNPDAVKTAEAAGGADGQEGIESTSGGGSEADSEQEAIEQKFEKLYEDLTKIKNSAGESMDIRIAQGEGYQFITFKDKVFFDGDSYVLREDGKKVLDAFSAAIAPAEDAVKEIQVLGHTTQADPQIPNEVVSDRVLSSSRSAVVVAYIQQKNVIAPQKLVSAGYGQFRPIDSYETEAGRVQNRRVEILIVKSGAEEQSLDEYYEQVYK